MKSYILGFLLVQFTAVCFSQTPPVNDEWYYKYLPDSVLRYYGKVTEIYVVEEINQATAFAENDSLFCPTYIFQYLEDRNHKYSNRFSTTFQEILYRDYGIEKEPPYVTEEKYGVMIFKETVAFDLVMIEAIEKKFGKGFIEKQLRCAERLIKKGKGYQLPYSLTRDQGHISLLSVYNDKIKDKSLFLKIEFNVSSIGTTSNVKAFSQTKKISDVKTPLVLSKNTINKITSSLKIIPGRYKGKTVKSNFYYLIGRPNVFEFTNMERVITYEERNQDKL